MLTHDKLSRRQVLEMAFSLGGLAISAPLSRLFAQQKPSQKSVFDRQNLSPTADQMTGPFYPVMKPLDQDADLTTTQGKSGRAQGQTIHLMGRVLDTRGNPVQGARLEIWQANAHGRYRHSSDPSVAPLDPNFLGFGAQITDEEGRYRFKTIKPGGYPTGIDDWIRPPHVHFDITGRIHKLVTQMYFDGEPLNEKDRLLQYSWNKESLVVKLLPPTPDLEPDSLIANWDIVLIQD